MQIQTKKTLRKDTAKSAEDKRLEEIKASFEEKEKVKALTTAERIERIEKMLGIV
jgi:hypothetical protein